jgi:hypothetical protein
LSNTEVNDHDGSNHKRVAANKAAFDRRVEDIRNHPDWSDEAKKRYLAEVERGYWDVSNAYRAAHPEAAKKWEAYSQARQAGQGEHNQPAPPDQPGGPPDAG